MKWLALMLCTIFLLGCVAQEKVCTVDKDCLPATCCHAQEAVNKDFKPDCEGILCTMECAPKTTDCGQGEIKCLKGACQVVLAE